MNDEKNVDPAKMIEYSKLFFGTSDPTTLTESQRETVYGLLDLDDELNDTKKTLDESQITVTSETDSIYEKAIAESNKMIQKEEDLAKKEKLIAEREGMISEQVRLYSAAVDHHLAAHGKTFDYKGFLAKEKIEDYSVLTTADGPETLKRAMQQEIKDKRKASFSTISQHVKKTQKATYAEMFRENGHTKLADVYDLAFQGELGPESNEETSEMEAIDMTEISRALIQLDTNYGGEKLPVKYKSLFNSAIKEITEGLSTTEKDLSFRKKDDFRAGVKEGIIQLINGREWLIGFNSITEKVKEYDAELGKLEKSRFGKKRQQELTKERDALQKTADYFHELISYEGTEVPATDVESFIVSTYLHQNPGNVEGLVGFVNKELAKKKIDPNSKKVKIDIIYVPSVTDKKVDGAELPCGIQSGMCKLRVLSEVEVTNNVPSHGSTFSHPVIYETVPEEFVDAVKYMATFDGTFFKNAPKEQGTE